MAGGGGARGDRLGQAAQKVRTSPVEVIHDTDGRQRSTGNRVGVNFPWIFPGLQPNV